MAGRTIALRLSTVVRTGTAHGPVRQALVLSSHRQYYQSLGARQKDVSTQPKAQSGDNPIAASMARSSTPTGYDTAVKPDDSKNASFLGEADSDDSFEADVEINPEAYRHKLDDVNASGLHGQAGEGDEPIERERKPHEPVDASQAAYLGEADSDDAHEADREVNPEKYRHRIDDASQAAYLGEADSDDAHEADREVNPGKYRHKTEDPSASGIHGQSGELKSA